ncbi:TolC family protein [Ampullimonas aquatilis]|uniref:TolC family protein n=1 Tax=Ampullimonas aquatilis TaxID=1341549 RepID=UPI003C70D2D4
MSFSFAVPESARYCAVCAAVIVCTFPIFSPCVLAADGLTLAQAQQFAVVRSHQLSGQDQAVMAARDMAIAAGQLPDPVLKIGIDNLPVDGPDKGSLTRDFMTMRRLGVMQELTSNQKLKWRTERYARSADRALAEKATIIASIQRATALVWLERFYAERMAEVMVEQATQARLEVAAAEGNYRAGRGSQADIFAARSALAMVDDRAADIQRKVRNAKTMLVRWTGRDVDEPLAGIPDIASHHVDPAMLDATLSAHPDIAVLTRQTEIAEAEAKLAEADKQSDWTVEIAYQQRGPAYSNMVSVGFSRPFQWDQKNRQDRALSSRLAMLEQVRQEREEMLRARIADTHTMINEWQSDIDRVKRYENELIPLAIQRSQATLGAYRGGKASLTELLAARRNETDVRLQALELQAERARLWAQLNFIFPMTQDSQSAQLQYQDKP